MFKLGRKKKKNQGIRYVVDEPAYTIKLEDRTVMCRELISTPQGVLCVQYDGTSILLGQQNQGYKQSPQG